MTSSLDISASGLIAQRQRMDAIAQNMANVNTTRDADGNRGPYRRKLVIFVPNLPQDGNSLQGVAVPKVVDDPSPFRKAWDPSHPDAVPSGTDFDGDGRDDGGYVFYPNVNPVVEMIDMIAATRAYEANVTVMDATKSMLNAALRILA